MIQVIVLGRRHFLAAFWLGFFLVLIGASACRPHPKPPAPGDSTVVTPPDLTVDTTKYDSATRAGDSLDSWTPPPEVTPADTLLPADTTQHSAVQGGLRASYASYATRSASASVSMEGLALGASGWNINNWCDGPITATNYSVNPKYAMGMLRKAKACGFRFVGTVPRPFMQTSGGRFSVDKACQLFQGDYRIYAPPDSVNKYVDAGNLVALMILDDMNDAHSWGGTRISPNEAYQTYLCAKRIYPKVPMCIRAPPEWIQQMPALSEWIDCAWNQYHTKRGDIKNYFDRAVRDAAALPFPVRLVFGVNIEDCHGVNTAPCTADELDRYLGFAISYPEVCFSNSWKWTNSYRDNGRGAVWDRLLARARAKTNVPSCGRS